MWISAYGNKNPNIPGGVFKSAEALPDTQEVDNTWDSPLITSWDSRGVHKGFFGIDSKFKVLP